MRALRWFGRDDIRLVEIPEPADPSAGEILLDVEWCGICGTDIEEYTEGPIIIPTGAHPLTGLSAPMTLGHEVAGCVAASGPGVDLEVGTRVALDGFLSCGTCAACVRNRINRCERWAHIGFSYPGGLAERMLVPARMALPAPDDTPTDHLAMAEPFAVAVRAYRRSRAGLGDRVAILGGGTIGLCVLQVALTSGCGETAVVEPLASRRSLANAFGADNVAADAGDLLDGGMRRCFDVVLDCTGTADAPADAVELARAGGRIVLVGLPPQPGKIDYKALVINELSLVGTVGHVYNEDTAAAVYLITRRRVDPSSLITHRLPLERALDDGFQFLAGSGRATALKILVSPVAGSP